MGGCRLVVEKANLLRFSFGFSGWTWGACSSLSGIGGRRLVIKKANIPRFSFGLSGWE